MFKFPLETTFFGLCWGVEQSTGLNNQCWMIDTFIFYYLGKLAGSKLSLGTLAKLSRQLSDSISSVGGWARGALSRVFLAARTFPPPPLVLEGRDIVLGVSDAFSRSWSMFVMPTWNVDWSWIYKSWFILKVTSCAIFHLLSIPDICGRPTQWRSVKSSWLWQWCWFGFSERHPSSSYNVFQLKDWSSNLI